MTQVTKIAGYTMGTPEVARSPVTMQQFEEMKKSVMFTEEDAKYLRMSYDVIKDQVDDILEAWYNFIGSQPHLLKTFTGRDGKPIDRYLLAVRKRFGQWIIDTARAEYDQAWLDYQHEIGLRHHRTGKNRTDGVDSTAIVPFRHLFLLLVPAMWTMKSFLAKNGHSREEVERMHMAWIQSCLLQLTLWSYPYVKEGDF